MTGHNNLIINPIQSHNPSFLTTLQATLEILDDISSVMEENTYLTLTNNLQQLYNIHTSSAPRTSIPVPSIRVPSIDANYTYIALSSSISSTNYDVSSNYYVSNNVNNVNNNNNNNIIHNSIINSLRENSIPNPNPNPMFGDYISNTQFT